MIRRTSQFWPLLVLCLCLSLHAAGPRWVTGKPYYTTEGIPVVWYTTSPLYFTDPGDLSAYVNHAAADAIVSAAANVWNIPTASLNLTQGGTLDEHVDSSNSYPTSTGIVFPADVQSGNYLNKQIAIIYDYDGSIIDLMLGAGASSPSGCRQSGVIESVDSFSPAGNILHAILVLNGRCTGPAPEQQLQMQYQLVRAFGRILGISWSQTNDNVFTQNPRPTAAQAQNWPIMHPIDIICGLYTYQCLPSPFTLRDDDIAALGMLYTVGGFSPGAAPPPGKTDTHALANRVFGNLTFPNGQGMQGVNIVGQRLDGAWNTPDPWESISSVSGALFRRSNSTPISKLTPSATNMGGSNTATEGAYDLFRVPLKNGFVWSNLVITTQPINPLYTGAYSVGAYDTNTVIPSGPLATTTGTVLSSYINQYRNIIVTGAASGCTTMQDGTEASPVAVDSTGWWTSNVCTYNHSAWRKFPIRANRSFTIEVTALDENALPSTHKAMPVLGLWNATDATGTLPTVASSPTAFNSSAIGTTALTTQTSSASQFRLSISDQRGDGRPDYAYQARILYADTVSPSTVAAKGGSVTITGLGFRPGNTVTVNGISSTVSSWDQNSITFTTPNLHSATAMTADITVRDLVTGGTTGMTSALNYEAPVPELDLVSAPTGTVFTQVPAPTAFVVKAVDADGLTPLPNITVTLSATVGGIIFNACGLSTCTLSTDADGVVSSTVTPLTTGAITLSAASSLGTVTASFDAIVRIQTITAATAQQLYLAEGATLTWTPQVSLLDNGDSTIGLPVQWTSDPGGAITFDPATSLTDAQSIAQTSATTGPLPGDTQATATACAWTVHCVNFIVHAISEKDFRLATVSGSQQSIALSDTFAPIVLRVTTPDGHPIPGAEVTIRQTVSPWSPPCPSQGRCPIAPVYNFSTATFLTGPDGTISATPLDLGTSPSLTHVAASAGTQSLLTFTLERHP